MYDDSDWKHPRDMKPWRDILRENGRVVPPDDSPIAQGLDLLQEGKPRCKPRWDTSGTIDRVTPISEALRAQLQGRKPE